MKKTLRIFGITALAALIVLGFASCEGPAGLTGQPGTGSPGAGFNEGIGLDADELVMSPAGRFELNFGSVMFGQADTAYIELTVDNLSDEYFKYILVDSNLFDVERLPDPDPDMAGGILPYFVADRDGEFNLNPGESMVLRITLGQDIRDAALMGEAGPFDCLITISVSYVRRTFHRHVWVDLHLTGPAYAAAVAAATALAGFDEAFPDIYADLPPTVRTAIMDASDAFTAFAAALPTATGPQIGAVVRALSQLTPPSGFNSGMAPGFETALGALIAPAYVDDVLDFFGAGYVLDSAALTDDQREAIVALFVPINALHVALSDLAVYLGWVDPGFGCEYTNTGTPGDGTCSCAAVDAAEALAELDVTGLPTDLASAITYAEPAFMELATALVFADGEDIGELVRALSKLTPESGLNEAGVDRFNNALAAFLSEANRNLVGAIFAAGYALDLTALTEAQQAAVAALFVPINALHVAMNALAVGRGWDDPGFECDFCNDTGVNCPQRNFTFVWQTPQNLLTAMIAQEHGFLVVNSDGVPVTDISWVVNGAQTVGYTLSVTNLIAGWNVSVSATVGGVRMTGQFRVE